MIVLAWGTGFASLLQLSTWTSYDCRESVRIESRLGRWWWAAGWWWRRWWYRRVMVVRNELDVHHGARRNLVERLVQRAGLRRAAPCAAKLIPFEARPNLRRANVGPIEEAYVVTVCSSKYGSGKSQRHMYGTGSCSSTDELNAQLRYYRYRYYSCSTVPAAVAASWLLAPLQARCRRDATCGRA